MAIDFMIVLQEVMKAAMPLMAIPIILFGCMTAIRIVRSAETNRRPIERAIESNHFLSDPIYEIRRHLKGGINPQNRVSLERMINRFDEISNSFHRLCNVDKRAIRKQNFEYLEVACFHESESMEKVIEMIDRGIPITHSNVLQLLEVIINGLETKYNDFLNLSTEEIVQEIKDLKLLQQKEIEDAKFIQ